MKEVKPLKEYMEENPNNDVLDYLSDEGVEAWNEEVAPIFTQNLKDRIWPKGAALIGLSTDFATKLNKKPDCIFWHYRNDRIETEPINEVFIFGRINEMLVTEEMKLIFSVGDKCFIRGQYGKITNIADCTTLKRVSSNEIGKTYYMKVEGINLDEIKDIFKELLK